MMNDMLPPKRPTPPVAPQPDAKSSVVEPVQARPPTPLLLEEHTSLDIPKKRSYKKKLVVIFTILLALITVSLIGLFCWYQQELRPVSTDPKAARVSVVIETGATPSQISETLFQKKLIRSTTAFDIYTRLSKTQNRLQAGSYRLSPGESTQAIVDHLVSGKTDAFNMTFLPGATLAENRNVFLKAGFKDSEIDAAFKKTYDSPLFQDKPATADLEGYIFGDTYSVSDGNTVEEVLQRTFDEFYTNVQKYDLVTGFKAHGLNLYQGITLASIIQREVSREADEKQVAQVFYKRLQEGTVLGSDVTFKYAAKRFNLVDSPLQQSPYNTRIVKGLPPGPIAVPGLGALQAVASPASGDYEFFLAGDDGVTYFAHTNAEHEQNIKDHCQVNCAE